MRELVLEPLDMQHSTYEQPLPQARWDGAARGHRFGGGQVAGGWHVYPEMAAAGLWTTPSDLLRLASAVQRGRAGLSGTLLTKASVDEMLTPQVEPHIGIGFLLEGSGQTLHFGHAGSNEGFQCIFNAYADVGMGAAVMTNSDSGGFVAQNLLRTIAEVYGWKEYGPPPRVPSDSGGTVHPAIAGVYRTDTGFQFTVGSEVDSLTLQPENQPAFPLLQSGPQEYFADVVNVEVRFAGDSLTIHQNDADIVARRNQQ